MHLSLQNHYFTGEEPSMVLVFVSTFVAEATILVMNEVQAHLALIYFLWGVAEHHYTSVRRSSRSSEGGVTCWPEAVQCLLRFYPTNTAVERTALALLNTPQLLCETKTDYSVRPNKAFDCFGNVYPAGDRFTMLINGIHLEMRSFVTCYQEETRRITCSEPVQHARVGGDALLARTLNICLDPPSR